MNSTTGNRSMSRAEVIERARGIAAAVAPQVERAEQLRRMPPENVRAMMDSGLMPLMRPARFGGFGGDWLDLLNICTEVGRVCGSTAWCLSFLLHHQSIFAYFPDAAQKRVFGSERDPKFVVSFAPIGKARPVAAGWELSGEWPWGSGGDHCDFGMVIALVPDPEGGAPLVRMFLLLPGQFRMRDVWHSVGLKGSGTNNIVVNPVFVPAQFTLDQQQARDGMAPGCSLEDGVLFRSSLTAQTWIGLLAPLLGVARGACEAFIDYTRTKVSTFGEKVAESAPMQTAIGESLAELDAAFALAERRQRSALCRAADDIGASRAPSAQRHSGVAARAQRRRSSLRSGWSARFDRDQRIAAALARCACHRPPLRLTSPVRAAGRTVKVGMVSPQKGPIAAFGGVRIRLLSAPAPSRHRFETDPCRFYTAQ
jgi:3-hydroxy-9,10-secoandrosta-1,3,5(10)-triene-9,17-dione monooxygenase